MGTVNKGFRRWLLLGLFALGIGTIHQLVYLRYSYYTPIMEALGLNNTQFGITMSAFGISSMILYFPGGWLADHFSTKKLLCFSYVATGLGGYYYATFPSYTMTIVLHIYWAFVSTLTFWATINRAVSNLGDHDEQGRFFGLLEGIRGIFTTACAFGILHVFNKMGESLEGLTTVINLYSTVIVGVGILTWVLWGKEEEMEIEEGDKNRDFWADVKEVVSSPALWCCALIIFCNYFCYTGESYLTPYSTEVFGMTATMGAVLSYLRGWSLQMVGGPAGGFLADRIGATKVASICFVIMAFSMFMFAFMPGSKSLLYFMLANMLTLTMAKFAMRGVYYATVDEVRTPKRILGMGMGFVAMIGYAPDAFIYPLAGFVLDNYNADGITGYRIIFGGVGVVLVIGFLVTLYLLSIIRKIRAAEALEKQTLAA